jgi:hypothetical protein
MGPQNKPAILSSSPQNQSAESRMNGLQSAPKVGEKELDISI